MSRVGKQLITIPKEVDIRVEKDSIMVKGPKGELKQAIPFFLNIKIKDNKLSLSVEDKKVKKQRALWGTLARLIFNMIVGVTEGFEKKLELVGVGYKANIEGDKLTLNVGFSHQVDFLIPKQVEAKVNKNIISISGINKQMVGEVAAQIRKIRKPEPYKGKGIKYIDEIIKRKSGKKAVGSGT